MVDDPEKARRLVGFMPDTLPAHRDMTVHEYLDFFARAYGLRGAKRRAVVESVEEFTNLKGIRDKLLRDLSKGMKQRVSLARALVHDPPVLVLDEPAAGLDPRARIELRELLKVLADRGKAILISSHILTELAEICNGAVIIEQGRILRAGSMKQIIAGESPQRTIVIRAAGGPEALYRELVQLPSVREARIVGEDVEIQVEGGDEVDSAILGPPGRQGRPHRRFPPAADGPRRRLHDRDQGRSPVNRLIRHGRGRGRSGQPDRGQGVSPGRAEPAGDRRS